MKRKLTVLLIVLSLVMSTGCAKKEQTPTPTKDEPTAEATQPSNEATEPSQESTEPSENMTQPTYEEPEPTQEEQQTQKPTKGELGYDPDPILWPDETLKFYNIGRYDSVIEAFAGYENVFDLDSDSRALDKIDCLEDDNPPAVTQYAVAVSKEHDFGILFEFISYENSFGVLSGRYFYSQIYAFGNLIDVSKYTTDDLFIGAYVVYDEEEAAVYSWSNKGCYAPRYTVTPDTIKFCDDEPEYIGGEN